MPAVDREWSERIESGGADAPTPTPAPKKVVKKKPAAKKKG